MIVAEMKKKPTNNRVHRQGKYLIDLDATRQEN